MKWWMVSRIGGRKGKDDSGVVTFQQGYSIYFSELQGQSRDKKQEIKLSLGTESDGSKRVEAGFDWKKKNHKGV